jgi:hypothetical protein
MEAVEGFHSLSVEEKTDDPDSPKTLSPVSSTHGEEEEEREEVENEDVVVSCEEDTESATESTLGKNGQPKKRVKFMEDDLLVCIREIPARGDSPLCQELQPCDPSKLTVDPSDVHLDSILPRRSSNNRKSVNLKRPQNKVTRKKPPVAKAPPPPQPPKISAAVQRLYGAPLPKTIVSEPCKKRLAPRTNATTTKSPLRSSSFENHANPSNYSNYSTSSTHSALSNSPSLSNSTNSTNQSYYSNRAQAYTVTKSENRSRIDLDMPHLRSSSAHSFRPLSSSASGASLPSTRVHLSPYRQSSASSMSPNHFSSLRNLSSMRPQSSSAATLSSRVTSSAGVTSSSGVMSSSVNTVSKDGSVSVIRQFSSSVDTPIHRDHSCTGSSSHGSRDSKGYSQDLYTDHDRGYRGFRAVPVSAKKVFAWNMANSQFPHVDEPSISPMWDSVPAPRHSCTVDAEGFY